MFFNNAMASIDCTMIVGYLNKSKEDKMDHIPLTIVHKLQSLMMFVEVVYKF